MSSTAPFSFFLQFRVNYVLPKSKQSYNGDEEGSSQTYLNFEQFTYCTVTFCLHETFLVLTVSGFPVSLNFYSSPVSCENVLELKVSRIPRLPLNL